MSRYRMVADDLTGANANCSLMKKIGLTAATVLNLHHGLPGDDFDTVAVTTDSRALDPDDAYTIVKDTLEKLIDDQVVLYSKRIDSTLRGNLGVEINAFFDVLGDDYLGICVPAYPDTGRLVADGTMYVNGQLLTNSDAGQDSKTPVTSSKVFDLLTKDLEYKAELIKLPEIEMGVDHLVQIINQKADEGTRLFIFDGMNEDHLETIAEAVYNIEHKFFVADPGPFSMEIGRLHQESESAMNNVLMVVGSVTATTIRQIRELLNNNDFGVVKVDAEALSIEDKREEEIKRSIKDGLDKLKEENYLLITTTPYDIGEERVDLAAVSEKTGEHIDELSKKISGGLAEIAKEVVKSDEHSFAGVFMSGGDITVAFAEILGASGIDIREEVIPLAAYGRLTGGDMPRLRVISKGGMVGDNDAMEISLRKLIQELGDDQDE